MRLASNFKIIPVLRTADYNNGVAADSIDITKAHRVTYVLVFGAITGDSILTVKSGVANADQTTALTFKYAMGSAALGTTGSDVLGTMSTSAALTLTGTTFVNMMLIVEVDMSQITLATHKFLTMAIDATASAGIVTAIAVVEPRYSDGTTLV